MIRTLSWRAIKKKGSPQGEPGSSLVDSGLDWIRTSDLDLSGDPLYPLSYEPERFAPSRKGWGESFLRPNIR